MFWIQELAFSKLPMCHTTSPVKYTQKYLCVHCRKREADQAWSNKTLGKEQREGQHRLNTLLTTNVPTQDYYGQFGVYPR